MIELTHKQRQAVHEQAEMRLIDPETNTILAMITSAIATFCRDSDR